MDTRETTLSEFGDSDDGEESDGPPTPEENAADIERLVGVVERLTDQVGTLSTELEQRPAENSAEDIDSDPSGMYQ